MKIRILGFEPVLADLPVALPPTAGFDWLQSNPGAALNNVFTGAVIPIDGLLAGVLLKSRDAKSFATMVEEGGVILVKGQSAGGRKLTEANFFVVHPTTGRGLYAHHQSSASLNGHFKWVCGHTFRKQRQLLLKERLDVPLLTTKQKQQIRQQHSGRLVISQMLRHGTLKEFLKTVKRVSAFEATFTSFDLQEDIFDPISKKARRKTVIFQFDAALTVSDVEDEIEAATASGDLESFVVQGFAGNSKKSSDFKSAQNSLLFAEYDYDDLLGNFEIRFDDWQNSIANSVMGTRRSFAS